jgi:hypothetical protein
MPNTFSALKTIGALDDKYLSMMFVDFFIELLPSHVLLPMLDAYFLEGVKVLMRYGLALIAGYKEPIKSGEYSTAKEFWLAIKSDSFAVNSITNSGINLLKILSFDEVLPTVDQFVVFEHAKNQDYLTNNELKITAYDGERTMFQKILRRMNVSRNNLKALKRQSSQIEPPGLTETYARRQSMVLNRVGSMNVQASLGRKNSLRNTPNSASGTNTPPTGSLLKSALSSSIPGANGSSPLSSNNSLRFSSPPMGGSSENLNQSSSSKSSSSSSSGAPRPLSVVRSQSGVEQGYLIAPATLMAQGSSFLDVGLAEKLLSCLPRPFDEYQYELRFATYQHGWDISSLYARIERMEACILLFHLLSPYDDVVIGVFNTGPLSPPNQNTVRGNGATSRVFVLSSESDGSSPTAVYYTWALHNKTENEIEEALGISPAHSSTIMQFAISTTTSLVFGGSSKFGSNAIRLDSDLRKLYTGPSDTYGNPPLLVMKKEKKEGETVDPENQKNESHNSEQDMSRTHEFEIKDIEIFCASANRHILKD